MKPHVKFLESLEFTVPSLKTAKTFNSLQQMVDECENLGWLLRLIYKSGVWSHQRMVAFACHLLRNTPYNDGKVSWDLMPDDKTKKVVEALEAWTKGEITSEEVNSAMKSTNYDPENLTWYAVKNAGFAVQHVEFCPNAVNSCAQNLTYAVDKSSVRIAHSWQLIQWDEWTKDIDWNALVEKTNWINI